MSMKPPDELLALYWPDRPAAQVPGAIAAPSGPRRPTEQEVTHRDLTRMARDSGIKLFGSVANGVLGFMLVIVATRGLGKAGAGAFFIGVAVFLIADNLG